MILGGLILAGGAASRMGADKAQLEWRGVRAVDRVADIARAAGAQVLVSVGPGDYGLHRVMDDQPLGGPVGGVLAGARALRDLGSDRALVLAVDAPTIRVQDVEGLLAADGPGGAFEGLHLPMVLDLGAIPTEAEAGWPLARLADRVGLARLACPPEARGRLRGANTPEERDALLLELAGWEAAQKDGAG
ncbi:MAG: molybdenum cofactor guanylyltransferase [Phenylobacterium sp.]